MEIDLATFIAAFKTELRRHGDIYHTDAVDQAIKAAVTAATAKPQAEDDTSDTSEDAPNEFEE